MRDSINQEDIDFYNEYGFVRIHSLLTPEETERLRRHQDNALEQRGKYRYPDRDILGEDNPVYERMFLQRLNLWRDYEPIREFTLSPRIAKIAAELAGVDAMRLWHDAAFIKQGWANPTSWHFDAAYWSFNSPGGITVWVALTDARPDNGGLYFMPGSHREIDYCLPIFSNDHVAGLFDLPGYEHWREREAVSLPLKAGDCTFHSGLTLHGSGINMTPHQRAAWVCAYMPDGSVYNGKPNVLPDDYVKSLGVGDYLRNDDFNPVVYRKR
ncbi:MAG: phytanoyl-CoA dioxygenase family protein [Methylobacter sp.]|nr:phytanoyl-CoA dioxygenase family protein [Methylobacter sp.]